MKFKNFFYSYRLKVTLMLVVSMFVVVGASNYFAFKYTSLVLALSLLLSVVIGSILAGAIIKPVKKATEGIKSIAKGDLTYKIELRGPGEVVELANSFNQMSESLKEARGRLHNYFYDVLQSFVRILEAKDPYTRGHSERVAEYSGRIAAKMGLDQEKIEVVEEAALLHDIGKLAINESILNKRERLTDEEWNLIKQHPLIGEDILRPVLLSEEMLGIVRGHHERFDGSGYPDGNRGEEMSVLAAIVAVADAYDAMTSLRAYRQPFTKEEAVAELKKNQGKQFNFEVVRAFSQLLESAS